MTVTTALARWSQQSNRRRAVETAARALPWLAAAGALAVVVTARAGLIAGAAIAIAAGAAVIALAVRRQRAVRHAPPTLARALDTRHRTIDLLQTALALEARGGAAGDPIDAVVLARAAELVPRIAPEAVAPLRLRASPFAGLAALAAGVLLLVTGASTRPAAPEVPAIAAPTRARAAALAKAIDQLAKDPELSREAREELAKARKAIERAATAKTGTEALAAMSDAQRMLDDVMPELAPPRADELAKMDRAELAQRLAQAAKAGDAAALSAMAREALRRASLSSEESAALAKALADAAHGAGTDPWAPNGYGDDPAGKRLSALADAADAMKTGDVESARAALSQLAKGAGMGRAGRLEAARRALASLRAEARSAIAGRPMSGAQMQDARAMAMRAKAMGRAAGTGTGAGAGTGSGTGAGTGSGTGTGTGKRPGTGTGTGREGIAVIGGTPGAQGSTGAHGGTQPSGAFEPPPETVMAEQVDTPPPAALSPEGVIRAIAEHTAGDARPEQFGPVRDHYAAIAESAMHRDEIPLTRRDFIQRYFDALRTREEP